MSKLKPKWVKTDIPREIKIKLWRVMKDNPTFIPWQEYIANNSQLFTESEERYVPYSRDTYKRLQQEIREMPLDEIRLLPDDLQVWVKGLRPDVGLVNNSKVTVYEETPHKKEESLIVHGLSLGTTGVDFLVTNISDNLLIVHRICVEILHWEKYDAGLTTGARIIDYKYEVKVKPNFIGEIRVPTPKFKYDKGDVDSFAISFISPPGNKYITRINFYCSGPKTHKRFTVSTDKFEIRFHKHRIVSSEGTSSIHGAIAQAQKLLDEAKRKK